MISSGNYSNHSDHDNRKNLSARTPSSSRFLGSSRTSITKRLITFLVASLCVLAITMVAGFILIEDAENSSALRSEIVELNESIQISTSQVEKEVIAQAQEVLRRSADAREIEALRAVILLFVVASLCMIALSVYLYRSVVRPFVKLQDFAEEVASGNLDLPLEYERSNPFGKFAWAFDHMRSELKRARASERTAIEENKSVMASLAHDLRTPVASIRAYSEALSMGLEGSEEERREYTQVIERRCAEVSQLVDDMLTHSLAELDRISIECSPVSVAPLLRQVVKDFGMSEAVITGAEDAVLCADELRLRQAIENLLVNASKYARGSKVEVTGRILDEDRYRIEVRDFGPGIAPSDIPFVFDRFYRGSNAGEEQGSGLGLYVVRYVVDRMSGEVSLLNAHPGVAVRLDIPMEKEL